jgi:hypothetical protein
MDNKIIVRITVFFLVFKLTFFSPLALSQAKDQSNISTKTPDSSPEPLNYTKLTHMISIPTFRAGSHDDLGSSQYYFKVELIALVNTSEERNISMDKRKKNSVDLGTFGETQIESLAYWTEDEKKGDTKNLTIDGNTIREVAAKTMRIFKIPEEDLAVMVEITLFKKQKKFLFFGNDDKLASTIYYPIPPTKFDGQLRMNQNLIIKDEYGTMVKINIKYL